MKKITIDLGEKWEKYRFQYFRELINIEIRIGYTPGILVFGGLDARVTYNLLEHISMENGFPMIFLSVEESYRRKDREKAISSLKERGANCIIGIHDWWSEQCVKKVLSIDEKALKEASGKRSAETERQLKEFVDHQRRLVEFTEYIHAHPPTTAEGFKLLINIIGE